MKNFLLFLIISAYTVVCADSILWMVNDDHLGSSPEGEADSLYNMARIIVTADGSYATYIDNGDGYVTMFDSSHSVMPAVYFSEETYGYTDVYPDGCGLINFDDKWGYNGQGQPCYTTGEMWSVIPDGLKNNPATKMYIELCNGHLDESSWEAVVDDVVGKSNLYRIDQYTVSNSSGNDVTYRVLVKDGYHIENFTAADGSHSAIAVRDDTAVFRDAEGHLLDGPGGNVVSDPGSYYVAKYESTDQISQFVYCYGSGTGGTIGSNVFMAWTPDMFTGIGSAPEPSGALLLLVGLCVLNLRRRKQ